MIEDHIARIRNAADCVLFYEAQAGRLGASYELKTEALDALDAARDFFANAVREAMTSGFSLQRILDALGDEASLLTVAPSLTPREELHRDAELGHCCEAGCSRETHVGERRCLHHALRTDR